MSLTVQNVFDFFLGAALGTSVVEGPSFLQCESYMSAYIDQILAIIDSYAIEFNKVAGGDWSNFELLNYLLIND